ncbi:TetR/AcrR family transcriptional regulator [Caproiciproducens faecalis]|uniref:TetR/AcrR family transcriptional regulator n=1 Tax=Caproiciproducens faecalis TaxID=2820301 RepID=A0ABS7DL93_9FIRM|nr:TetR/AcrR family transcriptional regulator [Caproiciproducens faecalis]MBW7571881.1 TetR/AcrR family transcriptional regulator [Caproiciproducens faecalis]
MDGQKKGMRRRGEALEDAILLAACEELYETGYTRLTMESVATRAGTNKAVLYRRWGNKSELVIAALHKYVPKITDEIPNTGNLRDDVVTYLRGLTAPLKSIGAQTMRGLMTEPLVGGSLIASLPQVIQPRSESKLMVAMTAILKNAEIRGEVCFEKLSARIISLPLDLLRYELITMQEPISDEAITEIVDDIFMPVVRSNNQSAENNDNEDN